MRLFIYEHCPFCCRARMAFGLHGLDVDTTVVMEGDAETPIALVGRKALPILVNPDGEAMAESMDIVRYIDGLGEHAFAIEAKSPALKGWHDLAWPPALKLFIPRSTEADFAEISTPQAREAYRIREVKAFGDLDTLRAGTPSLLIEMNAMLEGLEPLLADRTVIDADDFLIYPLLRSLSIVLGLEFGKEASSYLLRMKEVTKVPLLFGQAS